MKIRKILLPLFALVLTAAILSAPLLPALAADKGDAAEKAQKTEETADEDGSEETETKKDEVTSDHAPIVGIGLNGNKSSGSLSAMFANLKKGGR